MRGLTRFIAAVAASTMASALTPCIARAGTVVVHFIKPTEYTDIGRFDNLQPDPLAELQRYLVSLGEQVLPPNQALTVNFLDIDLAGTSRPTRNGAANVRVMKSAGDAPRITLEYRLEDNGHVIASGKQDLTDLQYLYRYRGSKQEAAYPYEKRLLAQWFQSTFAQTSAHPY